MLHLTCLNQFLHRAGNVFNRHLGIYAMLIIQVDDLHVEPLQRTLHRQFDPRRAAVYTLWPMGSIGIDIESKLRRDSNLSAERSESLTYQFLIVEWAIDFGRVKERHAPLYSRAQQRYRRALLGKRLIRERHSHAAQA